MKALRVSFCVLIVLFIFSQTLHAQTAPAPGGWVAQLVSVEGSAQLKKTGDTRWSQAKLNDKLYPGDMLRVMDKSRAAVVMSNQSNVRLDENTTITFKGIEEERTILLDIFRGAAHFFNRVTRTLKIFTPYINGIVQGTEFLVKVDDKEALISIFEGRIAAENDKGSIIVNGGQTVIARAGEAPMLMAVVKPRDAVQWALYYPSIMDFRPEDFSVTADWQDKVGKSVETYRKSDLAGANEALKELKDEGITDTRYLTYRATLALSVGRLEEASAYLERTIKAEPNNADAYALQSVIAVAQNRKDDAANLARKATSLDPKSPAALIALSYARQARFDINGATASVQEAVKNSPNDAYARARLAELWLSQGYLDRALAEANRAVTINPNLARTQTVLGYAYLTQIKIKESKAAFEKAITLDSADPLARLGLGLAKIRKGDLEEGRKDIEIAASLDVNNSLVRSYLGKAYYEEKRERLSATQFGIAKQLDPLDPTPYFYDAILKQSVNRPVEALKDIQKSIELNNNRAVYRSQLMMDQDLAARSASLGRIFNNLGFQQLGLVEGWKGVNYDPTDFSSHRLLAENYGALNKHQIAQASELLQAQMLQPININPVPLQITDTNLGILQGAGPSSPAYNEYNPLFNRNQVSMQASGVYGQQDTHGDEVSVNALYDRYSMSIGQLYYKTNGFRVNNDFKKEIYELFTQVSLTHKTSIQAEVRYKDERGGDLAIQFNPALNDNTQRSSEEKTYARIGLRHSFTPNSDLLVSLSYVKGNFGMTFSDEFFKYDAPGDEKSYMGELQYIFRSDRFRAIVGGGYVSVIGNGTFDITMPMPPDPPMPIMSISYDDDTHHANSYIYTYVNWPYQVTWTIGASYDNQHITAYNSEQEQVNPKIGMMWNPLAGTTIRAAAFRTLQRTLITGQTLEPTQVAGFNQFYHDGNGTDSWHYGIGLDQKITNSLFAGVEGSYRDFKVPYMSGNSLTAEETNWKEKTARAYAYWTPHNWIALSAEYQYEKFETEPEAPSQFYSTDIKTHKVPLGMQFFHPLGIFAGIKGTYVAQYLTTATSNTSPYTFYDDSDHFWVFDAAIGYRMPKRYGIISIEAKNLFNKDFNYTDTNWENPAIKPDRLILGKITLYF